MIFYDNHLQLDFFLQELFKLKIIVRCRLEEKVKSYKTQFPGSVRSGNIQLATQIQPNTVPRTLMAERGAASASYPLTCRHTHAPNVILKISKLKLQ